MSNILYSKQGGIMSMKNMKSGSIIELEKAKKTLLKEFDKLDTEYKKSRMVNNSLRKQRRMTYYSLAVISDLIEGEQES